MNDLTQLQIDNFTALHTHAVFEQAKTCAYHYMDTLNDRPVFPAPHTLQALTIFDEPLPAASSAAEDVVRLLDTYGSPATVAQTGGRYFGFVNGSVLPAALAAKWLADTWDQNAAMYVISPIVAQLETVCERWLVQLLNLPTGTAAGFVGGSATATLCGLAAGRNALLARVGWDVQADGLFDAPRLRVILSDQAHTTVYKALGILGLGRARVETVPSDAQGRLREDLLPALDDRCLVIAQAGNVNSGAFDPLTAICAKARAAGAWVHVDGAFGLWAAAAPLTAHLTAGLEQADSWSVDAHKTLNAPYDGGMVLCRDRQALLGALRTSASYMVESERRDGMQYTLDMSRRGRAVELWATLKSLGSAGVAMLITQLCEHAKAFAAQLGAAGFRVLNDVVFNQVLIAASTPEETQNTLRNIQASGECWCGGTQWRDEPAIRISVCSWATTTADVERAVAAFVAARAESIDGRLEAQPRA